MDGITSTSHDIEIPSSMPADKMFKAMVVDLDRIIGDVFPGASVEILEGDGGVGTVKAIHFGQGSPFKSSKRRIDAIDEEKLSHSYTVIEGDVLSASIESVSHELKIVPTRDGGSIYKDKVTYNTDWGVLARIGYVNVDEIYGAEDEVAVRTVKAIHA